MKERKNTIDRKGKNTVKLRSLVEGRDVDHKRAVHGNSEPIDHRALLVLDGR